MADPRKSNLITLWGEVTFWDIIDQTQNIDNPLLSPLLFLSKNQYYWNHQIDAEID